MEKEERSIKRCWKWYYDSCYNISSILCNYINIFTTILDPILIFIFKMGVESAAIATIFSQFVTFMFNVLYIRKLKSINSSRNCNENKPNIK